MLRVGVRLVVLVILLSVGACADGSDERDAAAPKSSSARQFLSGAVRTEAQDGDPSMTQAAAKSALTSAAPFVLSARTAFEFVSLTDTRSGGGPEPAWIAVDREQQCPASLGGRVECVGVVAISDRDGHLLTSFREATQ
jgi:hypothetical protein